MESKCSSLAVIVFWFFQALFPRFCLRCKKERTWFCESCFAIYSPQPRFLSCPFCKKHSFFGYTCETCRKETFLDGCFSFGSYADPVLRQALHLWKYVGNTEMENLLKHWINSSSLLSKISFFQESSWVFQPIPLHKKRKLERGFNQAEIFARELSLQTGFQTGDYLERRLWTEPQAIKSGQERRVGELDAIFSLKTKKIQENIFLCDDVLTSGATLDAAAKILKEAGAQTVWGITLARS